MSYYDSIDELTLDRWEKAQKGDLTAIRKDEIRVSEENDLIAWEALNFDYMEKFGLSRKHIQFNVLQRRLLMLELDYFTTQKGVLKNDIRRVKKQLETFFDEDGNKEGVSLDETLIYLSKFMGYRLKKEIVTVKEYYLMIEVYGKAN